MAYTLPPREENEAWAIVKAMLEKAMRRRQEAAAFLVSLSANIEFETLRAIGAEDV